MGVRHYDLRSLTPYRGGPSKVWLKSKNPASEAVQRARGSLGVEVAGQAAMILSPLALFSRKLVRGAREFTTLLNVTFNFC